MGLLGIIVRASNTRLTLRWAAIHQSKNVRDIFISKSHALNPCLQILSVWGIKMVLYTETWAGGLPHHKMVLKAHMSTERGTDQDRRVVTASELDDTILANPAPRISSRMVGRHS